MQMFTLYPEYPAVTVVPSSRIVWEMPPATSWCQTCSIEVAPISLSDPAQGWIMFPCHEQECSCCYSVGELCPRCEKISDACCDCATCSYCSALVEDEDLCSSCQECESCCSCSSCYSCGTKVGSDYCSRCYTRTDQIWCDSCCRCSDFVMPGWQERNTLLPTDQPESVLALLADDFRISPVTSMADFYLLDYLLAVIPEHVSIGHVSWNLAANIRRDAMRLQRYLIGRLDQTFQDYAFIACGGESRHHVNVDSLPMSRSDCFDYWFALGELNGREELTSDLVEIFDCDYWGSGYGGAAWKSCANILLKRLNGSIDAKTFVDRVFTLQHNGGSFLNKVAWMSSAGGGHNVDFCSAIGDAHAADQIDFYTLFRECSSDVFAMFRAIVSQTWISKLGHDLGRIRDTLNAVENGSAYDKRRDAHEIEATVYVPAMRRHVERVYEERQERQIQQERDAYWHNLGYVWSETEGEYVRPDTCELLATEVLS